MTPERITQMQCEETNAYLRQNVLSGLFEGFKYLPNFLSKWYIELQMLVAFIEYRLSIAIQKPQPGDVLQNIQFQQISRRVQLVWLLLSVVIPYLKKRVLRAIQQSPSDFGATVEKVIGGIDRIIAGLDLLNMCLFIVNGQYRSLTQRVLSIRMQFINQNTKRILNFSLMNRLLLWRIYELFLQTVLPSVHTLVSGTLKSVFYLSSYMPADSMTENICTFCSNAVVLATKADPCGHLACYYCLESAGERQSCRSCSKRVEKWNKLF